MCRSVHVSKFGPPGSPHVLTCSDDATVCLWDIPTQSRIQSFNDHSDYVRSGLIASHNPSLVLSGSYDGSMRLFDIRSGVCEMTMIPSSGERIPVEQVALFPAGTMALSSAGSILRAWDLVAGGRCIQAMSNHQKTITSLAFDGTASRLLTGGLDHLVKVYDISNYKVVHTMRYPAPVISLAISPDDTHIAAGMNDGTLSVRRREPRKDFAQAADATSFKTGTFEYFLGADFSRLGEGTTKASTKKQKGQTQGSQVDEVRFGPSKEPKLRAYDRHLRRFKYAAALDTVLREDVQPSTAFSLVQELIHRDALQTAISGRDDVMLEPLLRMLVKYVTDPRFCDVACDVTSMVVDTYGLVFGQSPLIDQLLISLRRKIRQELRMQREIQKVRGALDMVFATATPAAQANASSSL